jgi:rhamnogalacturonyl hydrolase YesR
MVVMSFGDVVTKLQVMLHDALALQRPAGKAKSHLFEVIRWLCRAQDAAGGGGVARSYSLRFQKAHQCRGWLAAYPETTGYIIPTFFNYADWSGDDEYRERALRMAEWEIDVQMENGAVQGGVIGFPPTPAVFNTGQVLFGWTRAFTETRDEQFCQAVVRAADFLVTAQDEDGAWRRHGSCYARSGVNVYDARTAWGLLEAYRVTERAAYRQAVIRNADFALRQQIENGWFANCCLDDDERPLLHTLAYTMEGVLEIGAFLRVPRYIEATRRTADALLVRQRPDGSLAGCFDASWRPAAGWSCLTGDAQTALVWLRLFQLTGERQYRDAAVRVNHFLATTQNLTADDPGVRGGIKGSQPVWGGYGPYEYLNWAAKFYADALLLEQHLT